MDLSHLTFVVLFYLSAGTFISMGVLKQSSVGRNFYLIHGLGASALSLFVYLLFSGSAWFIIYLVFSFLYSLSAGKQASLVHSLFICGLLSALVALVLDVQSTVPEPNQIQTIANSILSMLLLGFTMSAMLLGHWYLNQPKLSIDELKRLSILLIILIGIRFLFATTGIIQVLLPKTELEIYRYLTGNPGIFVLMRWFWGILGPLALSYFIWGTVKIRSTQSATGILYVAVVFVLIGEILSQYLAFYHGIAF